MDGKKLKASLLAVTGAAAIALAATFAWQSISQNALNEAERPIVNPGGRLHDDFSGWDESGSKDIYVENFGEQVIYARIRLDEYMEIGEGVGLKTGESGYEGKQVNVLTKSAADPTADADINDPSTWATHIPGSPLQSAQNSDSDPFHKYWSWTLGGKTVYMPTFNKNKDSLQADINGTLDATDPDNSRVHYFDYHSYTLNETADGVRDTSVERGAFYDADTNAIDEGGPYGNGGALNNNYAVEPETHAAAETLPAKVISMATWTALPDDASSSGATAGNTKSDINAWVYDTDGWAYWSQPIQPGTATGLLLDKIEMAEEPSSPWYYAINAVGQFITADDLGRIDGTGFYGADAGNQPTEEALDLLDYIGVNTAEVKGSIDLSVTYTTTGGENKSVDYAIQGKQFNLSAVVNVPGETGSVDQTVTWSLSGNTNKTSTKIEPNADGNGATLTVAADETGNLRVEARSTSAYNRLTGRVILPTQPLTYIVTVTADNGAAEVLPGQTQDFSAVLTSNDFQTGLPQTFTWSLDTSSGQDYDITTTVKAKTDTSRATLTVAELEDYPRIRIKAVPTNTSAYPGAEGTVSINLATVKYTVNIKDNAETPAVVTGQTVTLDSGATAKFTVDVTADPVGASCGGQWSWASSDESVAAVSFDAAASGECVVTMGNNVNTGDAAQITATNNYYSPALTASFTVSAKVVTPADVPVGATVSLDGLRWIVLEKDATVTDTSGVTHNAALLLSKDAVEQRVYQSVTWNGSPLRTYLNNEGAGGWLESHPGVAGKAIQTSIVTRSGDASSSETTEDKVFLLSAADLFDVSELTACNYKEIQSWEYTNGRSKLAYFASNESRIAYYNGTAVPWYVRSPSNSGYGYVDGNRPGVSTEGTIVISAYDIYYCRPAFWYNLD